MFTFKLSAQDSIEYFKVNGISVWSDTVERDTSDFSFVKSSNANWISFQPYGFVDMDSATVEFDIQDSWQSSDFENLTKQIRIARHLGYYVFLKPHLMLKNGKPHDWVGNMSFKTEREWLSFESSYLSYISELSKIADREGVEMFSIGTEVESFVMARGLFWSGLIDSVRSQYKGALTYSANFDAYELFVHWDRLDLIGIDAYFTVDDSKKTSLDKCREGWKPIAANLKLFSEKFDKPILFSEFGYMSTDFCAKEPYGGHGSDQVNLVAQANAYRAIFDTFWHEPWFSGGFSWIWGFDNDHAENYDNFTFSPQNKPAENIISKVYLKFR